MKKTTAERVKAGGDVPSARFGHTFTMLSPTKAVLFGGAISLNSKFVITNQTYLYDFALSRWAKLDFKDDFVPSERAAHAAVKVSEMQMIVYGGAASGTQGMLKDELYILDLRREPVWKILEVSNKSVSPGQRYGHTMLFNKPYLVLFAGNSGNHAQNDVWLLNIVKGPFAWQKYDFGNKLVPCARVYHAAAICEEGSATGMMVVFGGRKQTKKDHNGSQKELAVSALNDVWGLRKHRDGTWDWATPPKSSSYTPLCRYQHLVCFMGSMMVIVGGRSSNPEQTVSTLEIYDTQKSQWHRTVTLNRYRHAIAVYNRRVFVHGGFEPECASQPLSSIVSIDLSEYSKQVELENQACQSKIEPESTSRTGRRQLQEINDSERNIMSRSSRIRGASQLNKSKVERDLTPSRVINSNKNFRLSSQVVVATGDQNNILIQRVPVKSLLEESKKLNISQEAGAHCDYSSLELLDNVLNILMPMHGPPKMPTTLFPFKKDKVIRLAQEASKIVASESSLIGVRAPARIFGSLYGRYHDLLKIFQNFGFPDDREMESNEYVFLGNYVDKGFNSLETICLLMALKIKYSDHIILLRGKHEDALVNRACGLGEECTIRLGENINDPNSVFSHLNGFFDLLPLAAAIEDKYLCVHSGIGSIERLMEIKDVSRPTKVKGNPLVSSLLWGGERCEKNGAYESAHNTEEDIDAFLEDNNLELLINTVDGLPNGVDQSKNTLSVFSVTNFGNCSNKAGILKINKANAIVPCLVNNSPTKRGVWASEHGTKSNLTFTASEVEMRKNMFEIY